MERSGINCLAEFIPRSDSDEGSINKYMKKQAVLFTVILVMSLLFAVSGCGKAPGKSSVLVSVGSEKITLADFNERVANLPERYQDIVKKRKGEYLRELINDTLLYHEALRKGLDKDKEVQKVVEEAKKKILIAKLLKDSVDDAIVITQSDVEAFYNENKNNYMTPEVMRVSHILVFSKEDAGKILEELKKGADFEELARAKSVDPTAQRGGDVGYFPKGQLMPEFENACGKLDVGEISGVVRTKLGYHIIKLTDRRAPQDRPIGDVSEDIKGRLRTIKRQKIFNELLDNLRNRTNVTVNEEALSKID